MMPAPGRKVRAMEVRGRMVLEARDAVRAKGAMRDPGAGLARREKGAIAAARRREATRSAP